MRHPSNAFEMALSKEMCSHYCLGAKVSEDSGLRIQVDSVPLAPTVCGSEAGPQGV